MTAASTEFNVFWKHLNSELQTLSSEAKKRSSAIRQASDKSIEILKTTHSYEDLSHRSEFVDPFVLSCASKNAKLTTISMQCLQRLSSTPCLPKDRLDDVLDAFISATQLALDIKLKVLQILPTFFKNYANCICGSLCVKLLKCCSNLLQSPNKAPMVVGTASATLQQLIDEIFERLDYKNSDDETDREEEERYEVLVGNSESIKVDIYRYDANRLFSDLCSSFELTEHSNNPSKDAFLDVRNLPIDYGLEILESVMKNTKSLFLEYKDLQFILRIKTVPFLLRCISSSKTFSTVLRSFRCIKLLIKKEYLSILELEMEVVLSLLIHGLSTDSDSPLWKKALSLEVFMGSSHDFELICDLFMTYDNYSDRKHILANLLQEFFRLLSTEDMENCLCESPVIEKMDMPIISSEPFANRTQLIHMLDKANPPAVNYTYIIWLILSISNEWSDGLSLAALELSQDRDDSDDLQKVKKVYKGVFQGLFKINRKFLYSTSLDTQLFHSLIRAFQKLAHAAGILSMTEQLNECLDVFSLAIVTNVNIAADVPKIEHPQQAASGKLTSMSVTKKVLPPRNINQRQISLFRALISLSVSLGQTLPSDSWAYILRTWQWMTYYIYGPSADFMEGFYMEDVPPPPSISKNEVVSIENSTRKMCESTAAYTNAGFKGLIEKLISESDNTLCSTASSTAQADKNNEAKLQTEKVQDCYCNKTFFITQLGELAVYNFERFLDDQGEEIWTLIMNYFIRLVADRKLSTVALRLYASKTFTDLIRNTSIEIGGIEDQNIRSGRFQKLEGLIMKSLMDCIQALKALDLTKDAIYKGIIKAEAEILLQLLSTLKEILNEFGDVLSTTWSSVFAIVNSPFEWDTQNFDHFLSEDEDDSSLVNGIIQKHKEMIQVSYDVFKLVSDDFLQALPLEVIKCVIDTIVNFVNQGLNLNISFSSISQFWLVGDYLRMQGKSDEESCTSEIRSEFSRDIQAGKLEKDITSKSSSPYKVYNGLWLYLLKKLIECSGDERTEVKNGAVQTFFRIIDSHAPYFPDWNLIFLEVIKPLLTVSHDENQLLKDVEFWNHTLEGLVKLYATFFSDFSENEASAEEWTTLLNFLQTLFNSGSSEISYVAIINYRDLLKSMVEIESLPVDVLNKCISIWSQYNIAYSDLSSSNSHVNKNGYDCVQELITSFPYLYQIIMRYQGISVEFVEKTLSLFNSAVRYPLLPEHCRDNMKPSSLQLAVLNSLAIFPPSQPSDIEVLILYQLSMMITLPFETREKIERKLLPKLPQASKSRIPTFEAVSVQALKLFNDRLEAGKNDISTLLREKHMIKIIKNLGEVVRRKSLIEASSIGGTPFWVLASQSFRGLSVKMFDVFSTIDVPAKLRGDFCEVFTKVAVSPLQRIDDSKDKQTGEFDVEEFSTYRDILLQQKIIKMVDEEQLKDVISTVWSSSFLYEKDEIEEELLNESESLLQLSAKLCNFEFASISGTTVETRMLSKTRCSIVCLKDLVQFVQLPGEEYQSLRRLCAPYLVSRIAFVLRRYISNESLVGRAPIPKVRKVELEILLRGLHDIIEEIMTDRSLFEHSISEALKLLHPLILRTIPMSHKLEVLQRDVLELSLGFTKLMST